MPGKKEPQRKIRCLANANARRYRNLFAGKSIVVETKRAVGLCQIASIIRGARDSQRLAQFART